MRGFGADGFGSSPYVGPNEIDGGDFVYGDSLGPTGWGSISSSPSLTAASPKLMISDDVSSPRRSVPRTSCRPLSADEEAVLEALSKRPSTVEGLTGLLLWDTARVAAVIDRLRSDGFVFGVGHLELSGSGRYHLPSERDRPIDPS